jgi:hypothetical protein
MDVIRKRGEMHMPRQDSNQISLPVAEVTEEQGLVLARAFWNLARHYKLTRSEQASLLGMQNTRRIQQLESRKEIPIESDKFARVGNLLGIHKNLRILFPENREVVYAWMKTARPEFQGESALEWITKDEIESFRRLFTVRRMLDRMRVN